jgi:hypothetical protein
LIRLTDTLSGMRPDIIVEHVSGIFLFSGETERGKEWLANRRGTAPAMPVFERFARSVAVEDERLARDLADAAIADGLDVLV